MKEIAKIAVIANIANNRLVVVVLRCIYIWFLFVYNVAHFVLICVQFSLFVHIFVQFSLFVHICVKFEVQYVVVIYVYM